MGFKQTQGFVLFRESAFKYPMKVLYKVGLTRIVGVSKSTHSCSFEVYVLFNGTKHGENVNEIWGGDEIRWKR